MDRPKFKNQILQGDCVELLRKVGAGTVRSGLCGSTIQYRLSVRRLRRRPSRPKNISIGVSAGSVGVFRALKPDGTFWLAIGDEFAAELKIEAQRAGFHCRSWIIWYYTFGVNCANGFSRSHTHLFHFVKDKRNFTFVRPNPNVRVKSARQLVYADNRANPEWATAGQHMDHATTRCTARLPTESRYVVLFTCCRNVQRA